MSKEKITSTDQPESPAWAWGLVEAAVQGIVTIDELGKIEYMNPAAYALFGYTKEEILGRNIRILMPNPYSDEHDSYLHSYMSTGIQKVIGIGREVVGLRKDRSTFPMHLSISEVEADGKRRFTGLIHDITIQRKSQAEKDMLLRELNWRNRELNCLYQIAEVLRGQMLDEEVLRGVVHILDATLSRSDVTGIRLSIDKTRCESPHFQETPWILSVDIVVENRKRGALEVATIQDHDTEPIRSDPDQDDNRSLLESIARQLGEAVAYQEAEAKVLHASKLASIGELAAGMGHEINNSVNGIINCADILLKQADSGSKTEEFAELIRSEAERVARIVGDLLTFSRQDTASFSIAHIRDIVDAVITLSRKSIEKSHIHLRIDVPENLPTLECRSDWSRQSLRRI